MLSRMKQGWIQTLGGLMILTLIPSLTILCLSPDFRDWVRDSITAHSQSEDSTEEIKSNNASEAVKSYRLPESISKIAEVSEVEPNLSKTEQTQSSDFSLAILRLQRALRAYPNRTTKDVFRAINSGETTAQAAPCPFERIDGEQSVVLTKDEHGSVSLTETLNRCAAAVEHTTIRER